MKKIFLFVFVLFCLVVFFETYRKKEGSNWLDNLIKQSKETVSFQELESEHARRILSDFWQSASHTENVEDLLLIPLTLGRSGAGLYKFTAGGHEYVLRLFSPIDSDENRKREAHVMRIVGERGVAPKVSYVDPEFEGVVMEFLPWRTILPSDVETPEGIAAFAAFLREVHGISVEGSPAPSNFERSREWFSIAKKRGATFPWQLEEAYQTMGTVEDVLGRIPVTPVLIHNDLIPLNIMTDGSSFKLVDWPGAGMGDPFWDFIDFTVFLQFTDAQSRAFMAAYFGRPVTEEEWNRFVVMRPVPSIMRAIGGFAFSTRVFPGEVYEDRCTSSTLPTFGKMMDDFVLGKLQMPLLDVTCIMLIDAQRRLNDPEFAEALQQLQRSTALNGAKR